MSYRLPPNEILSVFDAPPPPLAALSPDNRWLLMVEYEPYPPLSLLARPFLRLGGQRVDPALYGTQRTLRFNGIMVIAVADGNSRRLPLPEGAVIGAPVWAHDSSRFAFTRDVDDHIELWVGEPATASARQLPGVRINDAFASSYAQDGRTGLLVGGGPAAAFQWDRGNQRLLVRLVPEGHGPPPLPGPVPISPRIEETVGKSSQVATYQDLLASEDDERLFEHVATVQLAWVEVESGAVTPIGAPAMIGAARIAPDRRHLLITRIVHPFSYRVPFSWFSRVTEVWDGDGSVVATVAQLPVSDEVPRQGVPTGPRQVQWQPRHDATLVWVEALDGGDPLTKAPHRERVLRWTAPFAGEPEEQTRIQHRFAGWDWQDDRNQALLTEFDRDRRWRTTSMIDIGNAEAPRQVVFDLSVHDEYNDPGEPLYEHRSDGEQVMLRDGGWTYFAGQGSSDAGDRPFLDRRNLHDGAVERLFHCEPDAYEQPLDFLNPERTLLLTRRERRDEPPNWLVRDLAAGTVRALTHFTDPHPHVTSMHKELIRYQREDGTPLSGTLFLPPGWTPEQGRLPVLIWAYPLEYSDAATAGQVRGSDQTFTRLAGASPVWLALRGFAVLADATMPVIGDPETMNDTYIEQVVSSAKAAVDELDRRGVADRRRVVCSGHSYGGFMTANLLAHSDLFAAGIARSGAYNRTLTPFGFQSERRSYWEAPDVYHRVSPFMSAHKLKTPILLIHGAVDNNSGTFTIQSERLFQALQGLGGTAKLVILPHESHGYRARESILHVLAETVEWAERYTAVAQASQAEAAG